jgi:hypothetical protein
MPELILGALALIIVMLLLRLFIGADPKALVKGLRVMGAGALLLAAVGLAALDRVSLAVLAGSLAWALFTGGRPWPGIGWGMHFPHFPGGRSGARPRTDQVTRVRTDWLEMELDHESGAMKGQVLKGANAGKSLDALSQAVLVQFHREAAAADAETSRLLEAYLDRRFGSAWRKESRQEETRSRRKDSGMSREEALRVLGLKEGASEEDVRAAHRRLMLQNHPDKGGSDYLAAKINEAKDVLLG